MSITGGRPGGTVVGGRAVRATDLGQGGQADFQICLPPGLGDLLPHL